MSDDLRQLIASVVMSDPDTYNEASLTKSGDDYCKWILDSSSWGGAIELSILNFNGELQTLSWEKPEEQTHNTSVPTMLHFSFFKSFHVFYIKIYFLRKKIVYSVNYVV